MCTRSGGFHLHLSYPLLRRRPPNPILRSSTEPLSTGVWHRFIFTERSIVQDDLLWAPHCPAIVQFANYSQGPAGNRTGGVKATALFANRAKAIPDCADSAFHGLQSPGRTVRRRLVMLRFTSPPATFRLLQSRRSPKLRVPLWSPTPPCTPPLLAMPSTMGFSRLPRPPKRSQSRQRQRLRQLLRLSHSRLPTERKRRMRLLFAYTWRKPPTCRSGRLSMS